MKTSPTSEQLQEAWEELKSFHKKHFEKLGVKIPLGEYYTSSKKSVWLSLLYFHKDDKPVHKQYVAKIVNRDIAGSSVDQQVRHLKRDGWDIGNEKGVHQLNLNQPSEEFLNDPENRRNKLSVEDWESLKKIYDYTCATCGTKEGDKHRFYKGKEVKLQKAHMDPLEAGDDINNIIPQCQYCNQTYLDQYVFDKKGRVHAVASETPIKKSKKYVKRKIWEYLKKEFFSLFN